MGLTQAAGQSLPPAVPVESSAPAEADEQEETKRNSKQRRTRAESPPELPEIVSDRPDFTESAPVVQPGLIQAEMGVTLGSEGGTRQISGGEMLLRLGVTRRLELRFGVEGLLAERPPAADWRHGISDIEVGVKVALWEEKRFLPALSLIPSLLLPTGQGSFSSGGLEPTIKLDVAKDLAGGFGATANINFSSVRTDQGRSVQRNYSLSVAHDLPLHFSGYAELIRFSRWEPSRHGAWVFNGGVTHSWGPDAQFDIRAGKRLGALGPDWFAGVGLVIRQPTRFFIH